MKEYYVYITTNPRKTVLYIGVTNDLPRRMAEHREDRGGKSFAGKYFCYNLVYYEEHNDINLAIEKEKQLKGWSRAKKEVLINSFNPKWDFITVTFEL